MASMVGPLKNAFRVPELRKRMSFTLFIIILFRIGAHIPVPGIDRAAFTNLIRNFGQLGQMMDIISGGALTSVSIFSLGVQPYINASIIIQLLTVAIPALEELAKEGETGRKKIQKITRYTMIGLALLQSFAFWYSTRDAQVAQIPSAINAIVVIFSFTAGTALVTWLGEQINDKGVGNGISILIFVGIVSRVPQMLSSLWLTVRSWDVNRNWGPVVATLLLLVFIAVSLALLTFVVFIQLSERRIPVQYSKRVVGRKQYGGQSTYLPIKVNQSGVLPVIFATSISQLPSLIISFFFYDSKGKVVTFFRTLGANPLYYVIMAFLILGFTFFYSMIQFNPIEIANNLQKNGGYIPGIRPGRPTSEFISKTAGRLNWFDAFFLIIITLIPMIVGTITNTQAIWFGGTSVIIMVGVCTDLVNQLESQMMMKHYKGFLS
mgnify:FL=1